MYTLIVGPLMEGVARAVGHAFYPVVPHSLDVHEYSPFQRHMRPLELLLLAGATWWSLNRSSKSEEMTRLNGIYEGPEPTQMECAENNNQGLWEWSSVIWPFSQWFSHS